MQRDMNRAPHVAAYSRKERTQHGGVHDLDASRVQTGYERRHLGEQRSILDDSSGPRTQLTINHHFEQVGAKPIRKHLPRGDHDGDLAAC
jgi:hypothetical protein